MLLPQPAVLTDKIWNCTVKKLNRCLKLRRFPNDPVGASRHPDFMHLQSHDYLQTVEFTDGDSILIFRGSDSPSPLVQSALNLVNLRYNDLYHGIQKHLEEEDAVIYRHDRVHFVLLNHQHRLVGHQMICGDGMSLVPCEVLRPDFDVRQGSRLIFEMKRAVLLVKGQYWKLTHAIAAYFLNLYQQQHLVPTEHAIVGYSVEPVVVRYLEKHGYSVLHVCGHERWIRAATQDLIHRYCGPTPLRMA